MNTAVSMDTAWMLRSTVVSKAWIPRLTSIQGLDTKTTKREYSRLVSKVQSPLRLGIQKPSQISGSPWPRDALYGSDRAPPRSPRSVRVLEQLGVQLRSKGRPWQLTFALYKEWPKTSVSTEILLGDTELSSGIPLCRRVRPPEAAAPWLTEPTWVAIPSSGY